MNKNQQPPQQNADEQKKTLAKRNIVLAWTLVGAMVLLFLVTMAKIQGNIAG
jgi:hypothetical protein